METRSRGFFICVKRCHQYLACTEENTITCRSDLKTHASVPLMVHHDLMSTGLKPSLWQGLWESLKEFNILSSLQLRTCARRGSFQFRRLTSEVMFRVKLSFTPFKPFFFDRVVVRMLMSLLLCSVFMLSVNWKSIGVLNYSVLSDLRVKPVGSFYFTIDSKYMNWFSNYA